MADATILSSVKAALGVTGTFMDETISIYIDEVTDYMSKAGVSSGLIAASPGVIARGVNDLWNNAAGGGKLSQYFMERTAQLVYKSGGGGS